MSLPATAVRFDEHTMGVDLTDGRTLGVPLAAEKRAKGYEGEACGECGNFTLVRNGTCLKRA